MQNVNLNKLKSYLTAGSGHKSVHFREELSQRAT
jgi:hypothetical protein